MLQKHSLKASWRSSHYSREFDALAGSNKITILTSISNFSFHSNDSGFNSDLGKSNYFFFIISSCIKQIELISCQKQAENSRNLICRKIFFGLKFVHEI